MAEVFHFYFFILIFPTSTFWWEKYFSKKGLFFRLSVCQPITLLYKFVKCKNERLWRQVPLRALSSLAVLFISFFVFDYSILQMGHPRRCMNCCYSNYWVIKCCSTLQPGIYSAWHMWYKWHIWQKVATVL